MIPSRHEGMVPLLGPAALGLLTSVEQEQLDVHLLQCEQCTSELAALTGVAARLADVPAGDVLADHVLSAGTKRGVAPVPDRVGAVLATVARERREQQRRANRLQVVLAATASVAVLFAGVVTVVALDVDGSPTVPLEAVAVDADNGVQARAGLIAHTWGVEIQLVAAGLASGRAYTVQVTTTTGEVVDAGAFLGTGGKTLSCNLNASVLRQDARSFVVLDPGGRRVVSADL